MKLDDHQPVKVLAVSTEERDHNSLRHILDHSAWKLFGARTIAGAVETVRRHRIPVAMTSRDLPDGDWTDLLAQLQQLPEPPEVIVMSAGCDNRLWLDVLESGAYDLIQKPLAKGDVFRIVSLAWRQWHDQWIGRMPVQAMRAHQN
ncbi:MAG: response regulator [Bryobacteraceae bacterium]